MNMESERLGKSYVVKGLVCPAKQNRFYSLSSGEPLTLRTNECDHVWVLKNVLF